MCDRNLFISRVYLRKSFALKVRVSACEDHGREASLDQTEYKEMDEDEESLMLCGEVTSVCGCGTLYFPEAHVDCYFEIVDGELQWWSIRESTAELFGGCLNQCEAAEQIRVYSAMYQLACNIVCIMYTVIFLRGVN
jgi:hypothetical protein